jgi:hypothetical protein
MNDKEGDERVSNEFDLERAEAGEPVESWYPHGWAPVRFIGTWSDKEAVCEVSGYNIPKTVPLVQLRMAPKTLKVRYRVAAMKNNHGDLYTVAVNHDDEAEIVNKWTNFIRWITDWIEVEVTE